MIKDVKIDFSKYSKDQLVEAFENVDDKKYPENALTIYQLLRSKVDTNSELIDERYTDISGLTEAIGILLGGLPLTQPSRSEIKEKLVRVQSLGGRTDHTDKEVR